MTFAPSLRFTGVLGIIGASCLIVGDFLITPSRPHPPSDLIAARASIPVVRVYVSGLLGAVAAFFYAFGAWHGYLALRHASPRLATAGWVSFLLMLVGSGIYHALFVAVDFGARVAVAARDTPGIASLAVQLPETYAALALNVLVIGPGSIFTILSSYAILSGRTIYPRWFVALSPFVIVAAYAVLVVIAGPAAGGLLSFSLLGNIFNGGTLVFFAVSTLAKWTGRSAN